MDRKHDSKPYTRCGIKYINVTYVSMKNKFLIQDCIANIITKKQSTKDICI